MKIGIIILIIAIIVAVYFFSRSNPVSNPANPPTNQTQSIQNDKDLTSASVELDNTDLDSIDSGLGQNDTDISNF